MKDTKISSWSGILSSILGMALISFLLTGCDTLDADSDVLTPDVEIDGNEIYVLANGASYIDLQEKLQSNVQGRLVVTGQPKKGELNDLGQGMLQYLPVTGSLSGRDAFEFTVFSGTNEIIKKDTVIIIIEDDSTALPCNIYPVTDYVFEVSTVATTVDVKANDIICGNDVAVSVYRPATTFPPYHGTAQVVDNKIVYTPGNGFTGSDKVMYKLTDTHDPSRVGYGMVYFSADSSCIFTVRDDLYTFNSDTAAQTLLLPVFSNDSLCHAVNNYRVTIQVAPQLGSVSVTDEGINYNVPSVSDSSYQDNFTYEVCIDASCKSANVKVVFHADTVGICSFQAVMDTLDLTGNTTPLMYLDVLYNDELCDELKSFRITEYPVNGTAFVDSETNTIGYNRNVFTNDSLTYEVCDNSFCDKAKVYIKQ